MIICLCLTCGLVVRLPFPLEINLFEQVDFFIISSQEPVLSETPRAIKIRFLIFLFLVYPSISLSGTLTRMI